MKARVQSRRPTRRELQAEARRRQLIDTGLALFSEKGWENTTIRDLAKSAGVAQGLIYHYFESKEALLMAVVERHGFLPEVCRVLGPAYDRPASEVLLEVAQALHRLLREKAPLVRIFVREAHTGRELVKGWNELLRHGAKHLSQYLAARVSAGELRPHNTEVSARMLLHTVAMFQLSGAPAKYLPELVDTLLNGIKGPREAKDA
ncbi:MAG: TetR/AcrR family transcriptional regulator [Armatimonadetes bacterium]|nr:TetR/AcrR family transcriptional regulator [Armatimonadota bacterium]